MNSNSEGKRKTGRDSGSSSSRDRLNAKFAILIKKYLLIFQPFSVWYSANLTYFIRKGNIMLFMIERFSYDLEKMVSVSVRYLFYQPMDEKIKTWPLRFPAKENPNMEKALFDWPIVLQYDVKAKYRLISRKFSGMKIFHASVRLTNQNPRAFVSVR